MKISDRQPKISDSLKISDFSNSFGVLQHPKHPQQYAYGDLLNFTCVRLFKLIIVLHLRLTYAPCLNFM